jgi:hypothetical protein
LLTRTSTPAEPIPRSLDERSNVRALGDVKLRRFHLVARLLELGASAFSESDAIIRRTRGSSIEDYR